jgi:hypothetical protein
MDFWTFLIALRKPVRRLTFAARCLTEVRARFAACLLLAMEMGLSVSEVSETKPDIIHDLSIRNKALGRASR